MKPLHNNLSEAFDVTFTTKMKSFERNNHCRETQGIRICSAEHHACPKSIVVVLWPFPGDEKVNVCFQSISYLSFAILKLDSCSLHHTLIYLLSLSFFALVLFICFVTCNWVRKRIFKTAFHYFKYATALDPQLQSSTLIAEHWSVTSQNAWNLHS